jgi:glycopeptide antibiotics resistance protein
MRFIWITLAAGAGLILWEFGQQSSRALFFDPDDLVATLVGLVVGWTIFGLISREDR